MSSWDENTGSESIGCDFGIRNLVEVDFDLVSG